MKHLSKLNLLLPLENCESEPFDDKKSTEKSQCFRPNFLVNLFN